MAKKCAPGEILRKAYKTKKGTRVKAGCIIDRGAKGKGPKTLPKPDAGALPGYSTKLPKEERHRLLNKLAKKTGCGKVVKRLNLVANLNKKTAPAAHKTMRSDMKYLQTQSQACELQIKAGTYRPSTR